jgi:AcrR family transcriptional regulator
MTASAARDRLLRQASAIFYAQGIKGVGVDQVVRESQVTRATFYRHFPSKEALVVAYLEAADALVRSELDALAAAHADDPAGQLTALADALATAVCSPGFRGCPFINAAAEYPDADAPVRQAVARHRAWFRGWVEDALARDEHPDPAGAARELVMLRDGAMVAGYLEDPETARRTLVAGIAGIV